MEELELRVRNVKCGGCASAIQDGLLSMPGVESIEVDITTGMVRISGADFDTTAIETKLGELGYPVRP
jgi:copper chaperone CopZ